MGILAILVLIAFSIVNVGGSSVTGSTVDRDLSPTSSPPNSGEKGIPRVKEFDKSSPISISPTEARSHRVNSKHSKQVAKKSVQSSAPSPSILHHKNHYRGHAFNKHSPQGVSPSPAPAPAPSFSSSQFGIPTPSPILSPSSLEKGNSSQPSAVLVLPPPPPNQDCALVTCTEPLTYTPAGSPCACVWPIEVRLRLSIAPYTFFPLVSELAQEIANGFSLNKSQARIMGANAAGEQLDRTIVLVNLVPMKQNFDNATAFFVYRKFWKKGVFINGTLFGAYQVVYVHYPGLPPSPPSMPSNSATIEDLPDLPYPGNDQNGRPFKPLGVDVPGRRKKGTAGSVIAVVVLSSVTAFVVCMGFLWLLLLKRGFCADSRSEQTPQMLISSQSKPSEAGGTLTIRSRPSSASLSFSSSLMAYTGTAKIFNLSDIEKATDNFDAQRILGEGGFGLVYRGILEDGRKVAVKVLKREDQQGTREFLAEVEMLSRLHHRNLVKLIGICSEGHFRSLVYELVPNGSLESHLHGIDKEAAPLDWCARMKIALGAARGLAYLHEDSNPRVIHRDFKSSNILLDADFTPKVSDFGLARTALDEGNKHISTRVMGTFGYLAPEYAMTGHLLVKSDVYSYGVVLLELLTGRKPVDLLQPPGQENLVAWARPMLTNREGLETLIDPAIQPNVPFDSMVKVAAIASMCVQPEVSHRPLMGEVVQALKLVCNEFEEIKEIVSRSCSQEEFDLDASAEVNPGRNSHELAGGPGEYDYVSEGEIGLSATDLEGAAAAEKFGAIQSESFRRLFNSAPLRMGKRKKFWQRLRGSSRGSMSDHGFSSAL